MQERILLSLAQMGGGEQKYIQEAFDTNWIVPLGPNVNGFENDLKKFLGQNRSVVALSAGTAAIHLGLLQLGIGEGDEVICQSFTFAASANPIKYLGAKPIFVDSEEDTWNISPEWLEKAIIDRKSATGKYPKAIIPVHLYGMPAKMDAICAIANKYNIPIMEDAAEAIGSTFKNRQCGTFGEFGALSFNGNKMITTSGGGALVTPTAETKQRVMFYATQARENAPHYQHEEIGYNYRMSNICAGIGRGQMYVLDEHVARRREIHSLYTELLKDVEGITVMQRPSADYDSNFWLTCILVDPEKAGFSREDLRLKMDEQQIETRPLWKPMHLQPVFANVPMYVNGVSESLFNYGLCLPSGPMCTDDDIRRVAKVITSYK
jgi:dTDP-4-amino-4,6-dideoxygalactose transaminase